MHIRWYFFIPIFLIFGLPASNVVSDDAPAPSNPFVVVLDAGHGGHDPGNLGNGYMEKNIALNIVLEVGKWLENQPDVRVIYTRKTDTFVDLYLRGKIANEAKADLFVSVHCDSHSSDAHGAGTFVLGLHANEQNFEIAKKENSVIYLEDDYETRYAEYDINSPESIIGLTIMQEEFLDQSIELAKLMQDEFSGKLNRNDRKVKQAGFIVLHQTFMPSVLVETGFLTNKNEGSYLNSSKGQLEMGRAIARAILTYKDNIVSQPGSLIASSASSAGLNSRNAGSSGTQQEVIQTEKKPEPAVVSKAEEKPSPGVQSTDTAGEVAETAAAVKELQIAQAVDNQESQTIETPVNSTENKLPEPVATEVEPAKTGQVNKAEEPPVQEARKPVEITENIVFKVQLMASSKDLALQPGNFNGLNKISKEPYNNLFRYLYGQTNSYREAQMLKANADIKGYPTSYIVAYKDGQRIALKEALKYVKD
jgi:N-acetylmuramoyl-L-alanine amidase